MDESAYYPQFKQVYIPGIVGPTAGYVKSTVVITRQMSEAPVTLRKAKRSPHYHGQGRSLLTDIQKIERDERNRFARERRQLASEDRRAVAELARIELDKKKQMRTMQLQAQLLQREELQRRNIPKEPGARVMAADCRLITTGMLAVPGKVGVVIDPKTTIYVRVGDCVQSAIDKHIAHRRAQTIL